ncbi:MAG: hypothetical protein RLZZ192_634 [Pseudomonadota bacterium]|jgi:GT2 family glycosyltransferase
MKVRVDISIVSHGHGAMVHAALKRLALSLGPFAGVARAWVTLNLPEPELERLLAGGAWPFDVRVLRNAAPSGFGANHNRAFAAAQAAEEDKSESWFVVMNPDIDWPEDARRFWEGLLGDAPVPDQVGLLCPTQADRDGQRQDFARALLTPWSLAARVARRMAGGAPSGMADSVESADWVNGACMIFRSQAFAQLEGFDDRFFMYCEDIDICLRLQLAGWSMQSAPVSVVHDAQRATRRSLRHLAWHLRSVLRLWTSRAFWRFALRRQARQSGA